MRAVLETCAGRRDERELGETPTRLDDERESENVEDRRGEGGRGGFGVGKGVGLGTVLLALAASYFLGIDPSVMLSLFSGSGTPGTQMMPAPKPPPATRWHGSCRRCWPTPRTPGAKSSGKPAASTGIPRSSSSRARGYAVPETFTHGTSAQRVRWFKRGLERRDLRQCNTFQARQL